MNELHKQTLRDIIGKAKGCSASRRAIAVRLLEAGLDVTLAGYTKKHAERLRRDFLKKGVTTFDDKRKHNRERVLTPSEKQQVIATLTTKHPKEVIEGCTGEYWTTRLLGSYIFACTGKQYQSKTSERLLFKEAHLTWHCPGRSYEKADPVAQRSWIKATQPVLATHWQHEGTVILCEDEMVLTSVTTIQKVWLPKGTYPPVIETNGTRKRKSFYGFLNLKTGQEHTFMTDWQNMYMTVEILTRVRRLYPTQKLVLIWDNCGWHRGSKVMEWIEADTNTEVIYFPPYTPDFNPQEHIWKEGRKAITHNRYIQKIEETAAHFKEYIESRRFSYELLGFKTPLVAQV